MKILVCGGRNYGDKTQGNHVMPDHKARKFLEETLHRLYVEHGFTHVIHGGATGADLLCADWAVGHGVQTVECRALWPFYGNSAGIRRNIEMLKLLTKGSEKHSRGDMVVAFPGGRGTADMVARAKAAGFKVIEAHPEQGVPIEGSERAQLVQEEAGNPPTQGTPTG